jgi:hypothetical protein
MGRQFSDERVLRHSVRHRAGHMSFLQQKRVAGCRVVPRERQFSVCMGVMHLLLVAAHMDVLLLWRGEIDMSIGMLCAVYMVVLCPLFQDALFLVYKDERSMQVGVSMDVRMLFLSGDYLYAAYKALKLLYEVYRVALLLPLLQPAVFGQPIAPFLRLDLFEIRPPVYRRVSPDVPHSLLFSLIDFPYTRHSYILFNIKQYLCQDRCLTVK